MPTPHDPNLERLETFARLVEDLLPRMTLVGGCIAGLLITDPGAAAVRPTIDVDLVIEATTYDEHAAFCSELGRRGFAACAEPGAPLCRLACGALLVDVMTVTDRPLGFGNRWYASGIQARIKSVLPSGATLYHIDAAHFLATKLEAFLGRGKGDYVLSHDLEDVVRVLDGRPSMEAELCASPPALRAFVSEQMSRCLEDRHFIEAMPGYFPDPEEGAVRASLVQRRMQSIAQLGA